MLTFLTMMILLIAVASSVGYSIISMTQDVQKISSAQEDKNLLSQWEIVINNNLRTFTSDKIVAAPLGREISLEQGVSYHSMPKGLGVSSINGFGRPLIYCPMSDREIPDGLSSTHEIRVAGSSYLVGTQRDYDGKEYVLYSEQIMDPSVSGKGVVAFIISPISRSGTLPSCGDVVFNADTGKYFVDGGNIKVITRHTAQASENRTVTVKAFGGSEVSDIGALTSFWSASKPSNFNLQLDSNKNDYLISSDLSFTGSKSESKRVTISSYGGTSYINATGKVKIKFDDVDVVLDGVSLGKNIGLIVNGGSLTIINSLLSGLEINDSKLRFGGNAYFNTPSSELDVPFKASETKVYQKEKNVFVETNPSGGIMLNDSKWSFSNAGITFTSMGSMHGAVALENGSSFIGKDSSVGFQSSDLYSATGDNLIYIDESSIGNFEKVNFGISDVTNSIFFNKGNLYLNESAFSINKETNASFVLGVGAGMSVFNSKIGSKASHSKYGVVDLGGRYISGTGTDIYSSVECWNGDLFKSSVSAIEGYSSATTDFNKAFNKSVWSCNK